MLARKRNPKAKKAQPGDRDFYHTSNSHTLAHGHRYDYTAPIPKYILPEESMLPSAAYQIVKDEMNLDANPSMNLASFVTTWMEPEAEKLMMETMSKNVVDNNIYPQTQEIQNRCVSMLADMFHSHESDKATGTYCVGSSEALMLGALALKKRWQNWRKQNGKSAANPNIVMTSAVQIAWKKFACYFDVEPRYVNVTVERQVITPEEALKVIDENTIGVVLVLGLTYTGLFEDVKAMNDALLKLNQEKGWQVGIHVDAATGGFIAPFLYPELEWDFRLPLVQSINVSGHKYGFVYAGVGWILFRNEEALPKELLFDLSYLGGTEKTFTLNFSRSASNLILQYYNFLRLGKKGYTKLVQECHTVAVYLADKIMELGKFDILSDRKSVPLVVFKLKDDVRGYTVFDIEKILKQDQWVVPAYKLAEDADNTAVLRIVIRESFSQDMAESLVHSIARAIKELEDRNKDYVNLAVNYYDALREKEKVTTPKIQQKDDIEALEKVSEEKVRERRGPETRAGHGVC